MPPLKTAFRRLAMLKRFRRNENGATAVEFAMISVPFFGILFAIIETGIVFLNGQIMESGVSTAGRMIMTGQVANTAGPAAAKLAKFKTSLCDAITPFIDCGAIYYDVQSYDTFGDTDMTLPVRNGSLDTAALPRWSPGNPGQIVVVRAYYEMPVYTSYFGAPLSNLGGNKRLIMGVSAFKNEPW